MKVLILSACLFLGACESSSKRDGFSPAYWATRAAAEAGDVSSQHRLAVYYDEGIEVEQDPMMAVKWFHAAAMQGNAESQFYLARHYMEGWGVTTDTAWAARWFGKAAYQGFAPAQSDLGLIYAGGNGLPQDDLWAMRWLALAERNGIDLSARETQAAEQRLVDAASSYSDAWLDAFAPGAGPWFRDDPTVRYVQVALNRLNYEAGGVDGSLGPQTLSAIRDYRIDAGLSDSGSIDADLIRRLRLDFGDESTE